MVQTELYKPLRERRQREVETFLASFGLTWDKGAETTVILREGDRIVATGSRQSNVLKCIAVSTLYQGEGLTATVVTELVKDAVDSGHSHLFLFTKPENGLYFEELGFYPVAATGQVSMLENLRGGARRFVESLERPAAGGSVAAIVANCNPFTNGHRYLVETAASRCDALHLFILSEDRSYFSTEVRFELVKRGVADLPNVIVHPTSDYLISSATFPDYFLKDKVQAVNFNSELDLTIFANCFAAPMGITRRFVGSEPLDPVTAAYNAQMHRVLPPLGVEVVEIPRMELDGGPVSASRVRRLLAEGKLEDIRPMVPPTTFAYLAGEG